MKWIRKRVLSGELLSGTFLNLGSGLTAEIAGQAGFDHVILDLEHGSGDQESLVSQLQALEGTPAAAVVRVASNEAPRFKRVLDLGPSGVMVPMVNTAEEARQAVAASRYPPEGNRGVAGWNRACRFGPGFEEYFKEANRNLLVVVQIETPEALGNLDSIAEVEGVDVLYVGPTDLSVSLGIPRQFEHPHMQEAYDKVVASARKHGKTAGILAPRYELLEGFIGRGFTFVSVSSDGAVVAEGLYRLAAGFAQFRTR
ncbi:MAG: 2-dehydro-3-deoxyglucarate aldolase [Candidatus Omnitrophica bacterium]|nr:2-dehydro-3-deoxyglucarate aldolase [Candidatus Omnitrophota bacterium]